MTTNIDFSLCYNFVIKEGDPNIFLRVNLPKTIPNRQRILDIQYSHELSRFINYKGNNYAEFEFKKPHKDTTVEVKITAELFKYDLRTAENVPNLNAPEEPNLDEFLKEERMIEKNSHEIKDIAASITGKNDTEIVQNIYEYIIENMEPDVSKHKGTGALEAARTKKGMCIDYCDLFVALCRAKNIPARVIGGYIVEFDVCPKHSWTEVYLEQYGWVPFDPTYGENTIPIIRRNRFFYLKPIYIYFTNIRNDEILKNCYTHIFGWTKGCEVEVSHYVEFRQPIERTYREF